MALLKEEEVGAAGRRRVYGRLYEVWRAATGGSGRVVWPIEIREAVRAVVVPGENDKRLGSTMPNTTKTLR